MNDARRLAVILLVEMELLVAIGFGFMLLLSRP